MDEKKYFTMHGVSVRDLTVLLLQVKSCAMWTCIGEVGSADIGVFV